MRRLILAIFMLLPLLSQAQRVEVATDDNGNSYLTVFAYGLQRDIVKTNSEMRASVNDSGITRRHHTTKGEEEPIGADGYACNKKISFGFYIAPYNINVDGEATDENGTLTWTKASGWDSSIDDVDAEFASGSSGPGKGESPVASSPTGCAAYQGVDNKDNPGDWRLPTQRELQVAFTLIDQAYKLVDAGQVESEIMNGTYWTATEFCVAGASSPWNVWCIDTKAGLTIFSPRTSSVSYLVRCVKDVYSPINER